MDGESKYFQALLPEPYVILGRRLQPFSLGHYAIFNRFDIKIAGEDSDYELEDFMQCIFHLHRNWEENLAMINSLDSGQILKDFFKAWLHPWPWSFRSRIDWTEQIESFKDYWTEHTFVPKFLPKKGTKPTGIPIVESMLATLRKAGYTDSQVFNMPWMLANYRVMAIAERQGGGRFPNIIDEMLEQAAEEMS